MAFVGKPSHLHRPGWSDTISTKSNALQIHINFDLNIEELKIDSPPRQESVRLWIPSWYKQSKSSTISSRMC